MASRTHLLFKTLGSPERLAVLRIILREGQADHQLLRERLQISQPNLSKYLRDLSFEGLVERAGNTWAPYSVPRPTETRTLLRAAGLIHAAHHGASASDGIDLAREMERQEGEDSSS